MVSLVLSLVLGILIIGCLILKLTTRHISKICDIVICVVIPILCIVVFIAIMFEASIRRNANAKELGKLLIAVEWSLNSNRIFTSSTEKKQSLDSLKMYAAHVSAVAYDDSLISIIAGHDTCMQRRIAQAENAVLQSIKWISRLNDVYDENIVFDEKEQDDGSIKLIGPGLDETSVLNIAFKTKYVEEQTICAYAQVLDSGRAIYSQAFELKSGINCFNIPSSNQSGEVIELGYIYRKNNKSYFKHIIYGK